jgi:hypothetical protein
MAARRIGRDLFRGLHPCSFPETLQVKTLFTNNITGKHHNRRRFLCADEGRECGTIASLQGAVRPQERLVAPAHRRIRSGHTDAYCCRSGSASLHSRASVTRSTLGPPAGSRHQFVRVQFAARKRRPSGNPFLGRTSCWSASAESHIPLPECGPIWSAIVELAGRHSPASVVHGF